jgi:hypothetical protein
MVTIFYLILLLTLWQKRALLVDAVALLSKATRSFLRRIVMLAIHFKRARAWRLSHDIGFVLYIRPDFENADSIRELIPLVIKDAK